MGATRRSRLAARVEGVLAEGRKPEPEQLDELLTDCAAEALTVRARILGRTRRLDEVVVAASREGRAGEEAELLLERNERAWEEWRELTELIGELRARRRDAHHRTPNGSTGPRERG